MSKHAKYGGSTASRTLNCPQWHKLSEGIPRSPSSAAAELGTALHAVIETCLLDMEHDPYDEVGKVIEGVLITNDHITDKIYPALDEFEKLMDAYDIDPFWVEEWVEVSEDVAGTADFIGLSRDKKTVVMADYKSGDGIMVYAEENAQGLFYTMCARHRIFKRLMAQVENLVIAIVQPSHRREEYLDIWETDLTRLDAFTKDHEAAVIAADAGTGEPCIGSWCAFCPAEATCPAKKNEVRKIDMLPAPTELAAELSEALVIADKVETWVKAVRKAAHEALDRGTPIEGFKLVNKRATRVWSDLPAVEKKVKLARKLKVADAYETKLKSPAQLEKVCDSLGIDWQTFEDFVSAVSSGTTLVSEHDKRQAVVINQGSKLLADRFAQ